MSAETVGAVGICMHLLTIPPGGKANAHLHENHETVIYILSGEGEMWFGDGLREHLVGRAGEFVYIPADVPHRPADPSRTEPMVAVLARTDSNEQESVVLLPDLQSPVGASFRPAAPGGSRGYSCPPWSFGPMRFGPDGEGAACGSRGRRRS